ASGDQAGVFLDRMAEANALLHDASGSDTIAILPDPVRPALVLRPATADDLRGNSLLEMRAAELEEDQLKVRLAWLEYNASGGAQLDEADFRTLLGLPAAPAAGAVADGARVLEAVWRPARGAGVAAEGAPVPFGRTILLRGASSWVYFDEARCFARV